MKDDVADVVVVGGGVVGLACAWLVAERGADVILLDATALGGGASAAAQGGIGIAPWMSGVRLGWQRAAVALFRDRLGDEPGLIVDRAGPLVVTDTEADAAALRTAAGIHAAAGLSVEWLDPAALRAAEPGLAHRLVGAVFYRDSLNIDVATYLDALERRARTAGARLFAGEPVASVRIVRGAVDGVSTLSRKIVAPVVVVASGVASRDLLAAAGFDFPIVAQKGHVLSMAMPPAPIRHYVIDAGYERSLAARPDAGPAPAVATVLQPARDGSLRVGSSRAFADPSLDPNPTVVEAIRLRAAGLVETLAGAPVRAVSTGFRPWTPDDLPLVGGLAACAGLFVAAGHNGEGMATALSTGNRIADLVTGRPGASIPEIAAERFVRPVAPLSIAEHP